MILSPNIMYEFMEEAEEQIRNFYYIYPNSKKKFKVISETNYLIIDVTERKHCGGDLKLENQKIEYQ